VIAGATVLVLGAAAHGFEPTLGHGVAFTATDRTSKGPPPPHGLALRVSFVALLVDPADNSAVIVRVANPKPRRAITDAPIAIVLLDRTGKVVGTSADNTDPLLVHVPYVGPGERTLFVNDTIAASARPSKAHVSATATFSASQRARLAVLSPRLRKSPFGWVADGTIVSSDGLRRRAVLVQAVVHRVGQVVAAGTAKVETPSDSRPKRVEIPLLGNANGGTLRIWTPPQ
jgi:hypothetical protein